MSKGIRFRNSDNEPIYPCPYMPIGSIYISVNSTNPSTYFGGTWQQIKDRFLLACGDSYSNGATGGEKSHTLTASEMPKHKHGFRAVKDLVTDSGGSLPKASDPQGRNSGWSSYVSASNSDNALDYAGGGSAHNNMPPYLAVYVWKRVS